MVDHQTRPTGRAPAKSPEMPPVPGAQAARAAGQLDGRPRPPVARPLVVRPAVARKLLGNIGQARLYEMINSGELDSFLDGRGRFITMESIDRRIARKLAEARDQDGRVKLYDHHNPTPAASPPADAGSAKAQREGRRNADQTTGV